METSKLNHAEYVNSQNNRVIERLVFPSGGSRYIFLFGVYAALYKTGMLKNVQQVAGTSAGSIISTMIALGVDPNDLYVKYSKMNLREFFGEFIGKWWGNPEGITPLTQGGKELITKLQEIIVDLTKDFFATDEVQSMLHENKELNKLALRFKGPNPTLSLNDLEMLHELFPLRFKQLFFETVNFSTGELHILNATSSPQTDVAEGCYAASSVPGILAPMEIGDLKLIDGGTYRQMPLDAFDHPERNKNPQNTLVFIFTDPPYYSYENTSSYKALYQDQTTERFYAPHFIEACLRDKVMPFATGFSANYKNTDNWNENYSNLARDYALNTVEISPCGLWQPDFPGAIKCSRQYYASGYLDTLNYLTLHELCMTECEANDLYNDIKITFEATYKAILIGSGTNLETDSFWLEYQKFIVQTFKNKEKEIEPKTCCIFIHDYLKNNVKSTPAKALAYAVEFNNGVLTADQLFQDVYQRTSTGWLKCGFFSTDNQLSDDGEINALGYLMQIPKFEEQYRMNSSLGYPSVSRQG